MKLLEYEAKQLLRQAGIPVPSGVVLADTTAASYPSVFKSQVPVGGRGKAGGIRVVKNEAEAKTALSDILNLAIGGHTPRVVLAEELIAIERELYLSILIDRDARDVKIVAHHNGGVEVESNELFWKEPLSSPGELSRKLAEYYELEEKEFVLEDLLTRLIECFKQNDATLIEINPLVVTTVGELVAADCKMELDDMAAFRHTDWRFEDTQADTNFVVLNPRGNVATIANGAGLAMATVDAVAAAGLAPANFLDAGGGATTEKTVAMFKQLAEFSDLKAIVINIFAGITRCDEVAAAIVEARAQIPDLPPVFVRLAGTNYDKAVPIMQSAGIPLQASLEACLELAREVIDG